MMELDTVPADRRPVYALWHRWMQANHRKAYQKIPHTYYVLVRDGISAVDELKPNVFFDWYVKNHMQYFKMRDSVRRLIIEYSMKFLEEWVTHGRRAKRQENELPEAEPAPDVPEEEKPRRTMLRRRNA